MKTLLTLSLVLALGACSGVDADWPEDDAGPTADTSQQPAPDTGETTQPPGDPNDEDGDGYKKSVDCNDWPGEGAKIHPGATENCSTSYDDNCNGQINEGCGGTTPPTGGGSQCVDQDKDGFCTVVGPVDCDDNDNKVKPGATENCSTSYDDNCNGQINEGCGGTTPPPTPNGDSISCTLTWDKSSWYARYQVIYDPSDMFGWWDNANDPAITTKSVTLTAQHVEEPCGVLLNTSSGGEYLAYGHKNSPGGGPVLHPNIGVSCVYKNQTATKSGLKGVSKGTNPSDGSAAYWDLRPSDPTCPHPVN